MKYLFSPLGGNDPVSSATCRHYLPDIVYLYLSQEMVNRQRQDDRYRYCIEKLGEMMEHRFSVTCIENENQKDVQEYDFYYEAFAPILNQIQDSMKEEDVLYVNIASGTPAMKSALLLLAVMSEKKMIPIQVITPAKDINIHTGKDRDYDPVYYWEINNDNEPSALNRCREPHCPNLVYILKRQILIRHIESYNYAAAAMLANELKDDLPSDALSLIEFAVERLQLDLKNGMHILQSFTKEEQKNIMPVQSGNAVKIFEYALGLQIKIKHKEYCDFVRAISPLLTDLFETILQQRFKINISPYCNDLKKGKVNSGGVRGWNVNKLEKTQEGRQFLLLFRKEFGGDMRNNTPVAASNLKPLLEYYLNGDKISDKVVHMRAIEEKIRNLAAHEIVSITDDNIAELLGESITINGIYKELQVLTQYAFKDIRGESWQAYENMNRLILDRLL